MSTTECMEGYMAVHSQNEGLDGFVCLDKAEGVREVKPMATHARVPVGGVCGTQCEKKSSMN